MELELAISRKDRRRSQLCRLLEGQQQLSRLARFLEGRLRRLTTNEEDLLRTGPLGRSYYRCRQSIPLQGIFVYKPM